jgi:hypothetical protein
MNETNIYIEIINTFSCLKEQGQNPKNLSK